MASEADDRKAIEAKVAAWLVDHGLTGDPVVREMLLDFGVELSRDVRKALHILVERGLLDRDWHRDSA